MPVIQQWGAKHGVDGVIWTDLRSNFEDETGNPVSSWPRSFRRTDGLAEVIGQIEATILIGLATAGVAFSEPIVREKGTEGRPADPRG